MHQLTIINQNGQLLADSREVAEMTEVRHADLLEKIKGYIQHLLNGNFRSSDFFIESTYQDGLNREKPCFLLTRKGCDMVANKMTGEKGVLFTAAYVTKFEEMEKQLTKPTFPQMSPAEVLAGVANQLVEQERRLADIESRVDRTEKQQGELKEILALNPTDARKKVNQLLNRIAQSAGGAGSYQDVRTESYRRLEERARCDLAKRVTNKKQRLALEGLAKSKIDKINNLDVIFEDGRLAEIYFAIVKEMAVANRIEVEAS